MSSIINFIIKNVLTFFLISFPFLTNTVNSKEIVQDGDQLIISLKNYTVSEEHHKNIILTENASVVIKINEVPNEVSFILLQVHSYQYSVTLKYTNKIADENNINGTNIGLIKFKSLDNFNFYLSNYNDVNVSTMIVVVGYPNKNPVPGACAMESPTETAPYIDINYTNSIITVQCGPADILYTTGSCTSGNQLEYTFHHMFMPENDFTEDTYFTSILKMITYDKVIENSIVAPKFPSGSTLQRKFSHYYRIGTVYTVTVKSVYTKAISVYVPAVTYACDTIYSFECPSLLSLFGRIALTLLIIFEFILLSKGNKWFFYEHFTRCMFASGFFSYVFLIRNPILDYDLLMVATAIGFASSLIWTSICWCIRNPLLTYFIPILTFSCFVTAIIFSMFFGDIPLFESDMNYWTIFISVSLVILIICLLTFPIVSYAIANWAISAYIFITGFGLLSFTSSIPYVTVNVMRRATVDGFNEANTVIPFQSKDTILLIIACIVVLVVRAYKFVITCRRLPYPPIPSLYRMNDEQQRLLG